MVHMRCNGGPMWSVTAGPRIAPKVRPSTGYARPSTSCLRRIREKSWRGPSPAKRGSLRALCQHDRHARAWVGRGPETESANTLVRRHGTVHPPGSPPRHARHATTKPATAGEPDARFGGRGRAPLRPLSCGQTHGEGHQTSGYTRQRGGWSDQSRWFRTAPCMRAVSSRTGSSVANSQSAVSRALSARIPSSGKPRSTGLSTAGGHATARPGRPDTSAGRP